MSDKPEVIISEVEASDDTVQAVRDAIPAGVAGRPIERASLDAGLAAMATAGITTKRMAGTDRCIRVVQVPLQGGASQPAHCFRATVSVGDMKLCPEHDKAAFGPSQTPVAKGRVINSASIELSAGEKTEMNKISKSFASPAETIPGVAAVQRLHENLAKLKDGEVGPEPHHDLKVYFTLDELAGRDVLAVIKEKICESLDGLPCRNVREMKQIVALQEKIAKLSKGGKRHERITEGG